MKAYLLAYSASAVWLVLVYASLSQYKWYRALSIGTWGFLTIEALTMLPVLLFLFLAELGRKASAKQASNKGGSDG